METGSMADWFSAAGTIFSAVVALSLGLHKKAINASFMVNYSIILKKWTLTVSNAGINPLNFDVRIIDKNGKTYRTMSGVEARKLYDGVCPGGEIELLPDTPSMHLNLLIRDNISSGKVRLQFIKQNRKETLYRVWLSLMGHKIFYKKIDEGRINPDDFGLSKH